MNMSGPQDSLTGVKCLNIGGRIIDQRQRCLGMTDEERRWRAQFLKDQILDHEEPRFVPEYYKYTTNFFRRLYKTPMHKFELFLGPKVGANNAYYIRQIVGKTFLILPALYGLCYFFKYHTDDFTTHRTVHLCTMCKIVYPDDPDYPNLREKKLSDYNDKGFYSSVLCQDVKFEEPPPPPPPPPPNPSTVQDDGSDCPRPEDLEKE